MTPAPARLHLPLDVQLTAQEVNICEPTLELLR
jgi:hypothetical protein